MISSLLTQQDFTLVLSRIVCEVVYCYMYFFYVNYKYCGACMLSQLGQVKGSFFTSFGLQLPYHMYDVHKIDVGHHCILQKIAPVAMLLTYICRGICNQGDLLLQTKCSKGGKRCTEWNEVINKLQSIFVHDLLQIKHQFAAVPGLQQIEPNAWQGAQEPWPL